MADANSISVANWEGLATRAGFTAGDIARCKDKNINTIATFASGAGITQGQSDEAAMIALTAKVLGLGLPPRGGWGETMRKAIDDDIPKVRLLFNQCYIGHAAALEAWANGTKDNQPVKLLPQERNFRNNAIKTALESGGAPRMDGRHGQC